MKSINDISAVYLCPNGYLGGAERYVIDTVAGHFKYGRLKPMIVFFSDGPAVELAREKGITCHVLQTPFRLSRPLNLFKALRELRALFLRYNWNLYHATMAYGQIMGAMATLGLDLKKVWYQHGPVGEKLDLIASFFRVDKILTNSSYTLELHRRAPALSSPLYGEEVIPPGIELDEVEESRLIKIKENLNPKKIHLLMAGRITPFKRYEVAIEALDHLFRRQPYRKDQIELLIVGGVGRREDEAYFEKLKESVSKYKLNGSVRFVGATTSMTEFYDVSDILIHTPQAPEPFGLVVAEAMSREVIVLASDAGGAKDLLKDRVTGLSINFDDPNIEEVLSYKIANLVKWVEEDLPLLGQMKSLAKKNIGDNYSLKATIQRLEKCYESLN